MSGGSSHLAAVTNKGSLLMLTDSAGGNRMGQVCLCMCLCMCLCLLCACGTCGARGILWVRACLGVCVCAAMEPTRSGSHALMSTKHTHTHTEIAGLPGDE